MISARGTVMQRLLLVLAVLLLCMLTVPVQAQTATSTASRTPTLPPCVGDCNHDGVVSSDEVAVCRSSVDVGLSVACLACDSNGDGLVSFGEFSLAARNAANGCPGMPTFTPTQTPTPSPPSFTPSQTPTATAPLCVGDCDGDGVVSAGEAATCCGGISLDGPCPACDANGDGDVTVSECIIATQNAAIGCPGMPTFTPKPTATPTARPSCVGDCNGDHEVTIEELIKGVNIALGALPLSDCPSFDSSGDGTVTVDELIRGVNNALNGCG